MGGGSDSRIPSILKECLPECNIVIRTYDFDPEIANRQIAEWNKETCPSLVVGESLGSIHALALSDLPCILVSPALNAPSYFGFLSFATLLPGISSYLDKRFKPKDGDRQPIHFCHSNMKKWPKFRRLALQRDKSCIHAFFGIHDHYMKTGIVNVRTYERCFGNSYTLYDGTHFMENEFIHSMLVPKIREMI